MASMNGIIAKISSWGNAVSKNTILQAISSGIMSMFPIIIVGSFASLFSGIPIPAYQEFLTTSGVNVALSAVVNATTNMLGLFFTYGVARSYGENIGVKAPAAGVLALVVYVALMPTLTSEDGVTSLAFDYLGTKGMILGIVIAFLATKLFHLIVSKNIVIKMPTGTPDFVSNSFVSLIPAFAIALCAIVVRMIFALTPWGDAFSCFYALIQMPIQGLIGGNIASVVLISVIMCLLWCFGIHPGFITSLIGPLFMMLDGANQAAYAAGEALPNIIGMNFNYITTIAIAYPAVPIAILLVARSAQLRTVGKVALAPGFFGINEPIIFGLPIVLNPVAAIPFIVTPLVNVIGMYALQSLGIVAKCVGILPFNIPVVITGMLSGGISIAIAEVVFLIIDILIWIPFIKAMGATRLKAEQEAQVA